jgi:ribonucleotide reductase alpha subunit
MWMRIAVQVAMPQYTWVNKGKWMKVISGSIEEVRETYEILSRREGIHATPTCVNAGFHIPQLESCFVVPMGDSMLSISDVHKIAAMGSKCNGGFGIDVGRIRHSRVANRGNTKGIPGVLKLFNTLVPYADQLGSRPAAINVLAPVWHVDIETFLTMRDMKAPKDIQCTNLNYTVSIPDLFYKRCIADVSKSDDPVLNRG